MWSSAGALTPLFYSTDAGRFERVQAANTAALNVFEVARYQRHAVGLRRRSQQRIDGSQRFARIHSTPDLRDSLIDGQYSFAERRQDLLQPMFQRGSSLPISRTQPFDSLSYLPDDENTQEEFVVAGIAIPVRPRGDRSAGLCQLPI